jgi:tetratricopeptide (TPR) repeat protein
LAQAAITPVTVALAVVFATLCLIAAGSRHRRLGVKALVWTVLFLAPVLGFVPLSRTVAAERYLYIPSFGFCAVVGWLVARPVPSRRLHAARLAAAAGVAAVLALGTVVRAETWRNEESLYLAMTRSSPDAAIGYDGLGNVSYKRGDAERAVIHYRRALEKEPRAHRTYNNLGKALERLGRTDEATGSYRAGLKLRPDSPLLHFNLANALAGQGRTAEGIAHYREALRLDPGSLETMNNLAWALATGPDAAPGGIREAIGLARRACDLSGWSNPTYLDTLSVALEAAGERGAAADMAARALNAARAAGDRRLEAEILRRVEAGGGPARRRQ